MSYWPAILIFVAIFILIWALAFLVASFLSRKEVRRLTRLDVSKEVRMKFMLSQLRESVRTSQALFSALPDLILRVSDEGRILDYQCAAERAPDFLPPSEKLVGRHLGEVILPRDAAADPGLWIRRVVESREMEVCALQVPALSDVGRIYYLELRIVPCGNHDALVIFQDITERVNTWAILREQQRRVAAAGKMAALGQMASGIAHEINNPLAVIHGYAQQLMSDANEGRLELSTLHETARRIESTSQRISSIIRSLRFLARDGDGDPFEQSGIQALVADTLELCRERFARNQITLRLAPIAEGLGLECRSVQLSQVLLNLLNNAHDAVASLPPEARWIALTAETKGAQGESLVISVSDAGPGVPEGIRERIFEPFFSGKEVGQGTGLGLSITRAIVENHHGTIALDTASPHTRFVVTLPKRQACLEQS